MGISEDAKGETWSTRTKQVGVASHSDYTGREGGAGRTGYSDGYLSVGATGAPGAQANSIVTGGILEQLIQDAEDQLQSSIECIEWYERERDKNLKRLSRLKELQDLRQESDEPTPAE